MFKKIFFKFIMYFFILFSLVACDQNDIKNIAEKEKPNLTKVQQEDEWYQNAQRTLQVAQAYRPIDNQAKNVIIFIGDGMSLGTITSSRIYHGQKLGNSGEEYKLNMEVLPNVALSKTYNTDMQTPDSAGTASAMMTGVKTKSGVISLNDNISRGFCNNVDANKVKTIFEISAQKGKTLGLITTTRLTHATPATTYAHSPSRGWENDSKLTDDAKAKGCKDIAEQFVNFDYGNGFKVVFAGGRREFMPKDMDDPQEQGKKGRRTDGRNLIAEWQKRYPKGKYIYSKEGFDAIEDNIDRVFGLFSNSHMQYEIDRLQDDKEPSLAEMTDKAISILSKDQNGYVMMVEAGRIDHAHHSSNAARAFEDTVAFDEAIRVALEKTNREDTLIIITADHSHSMVLNGYAARGNPILGLSKSLGDFNKDNADKNYTTVTYGNGPGALVDGDRHNVTEEQVTNVDYVQQSLIPLDSETHSGEDVVIFARGPKAWLFQGTVEQNYIFHVMYEALGFKNLN